MTTVYLSMKEVRILHQRTLEVHGGKTGVRDLGLLESAITRPQSGYYKSLSQQTAALLQSLCMNHCFIDGNKRVALLATVTFLKLNHFNLKCKKLEFSQFIFQNVIKSHEDINKISQWLEKRMEEI